MDKKIGLATFLFGIMLLGVTSAGSFQEIAGVLHFNLVDVSSQTQTWTLVNTYNAPLPISITTLDVPGITISSNVLNATIPANSIFPVAITASLDSNTPGNAITTVNAYVSAFTMPSSSNMVATFREGVSKELEITALMPANAINTTTTTTISPAPDPNPGSTGYSGNLGGGSNSGQPTVTPFNTVANVVSPTPSEPLGTTTTTIIPAISTIATTAIATTTTINQTVVVITTPNKLWGLTVTEIYLLIFLGMVIFCIVIAILMRRITAGKGNPPAMGTM